MSPTTLDRAEMLKRNPQLNIEQIAEMEATLARLEAAGIFQSHYLVEPALGAIRKLNDQPTARLLNLSMHNGR